MAARVRSDPIRGRDILVVEHEFGLATRIAEALGKAGARVIGPVPRLGAALQVVRSSRIDGAVIDVAPRGGDAYPLARLCRDRGVPFALVASADDRAAIPDDLADAPVLEKPIDMARLAELLRRVFS